ncbi:MAG: hypothetical protein AAF066_17490 [Pseudomonadota bacterium]
MNSEGEFDWQNASVTERVEPTKALYQIMRALSQSTGERFDDLVEAAQDQPISEAMDPHSNFRTGSIAWHRAAKIHEWLARNHFKFAQKLIPELFQYPRQSEWEMFVEAHAIVGRLKIVALKQSLGLVERDDEHLPTENTLRLTQRFCFELDTNLRGVAVAFQRYDREWHALPLGAEKRNPKARIVENPQLFPRKVNGSPMGLRENNDAGDHVFAVLVAQNPKTPIDMLSLAKLEPAKDKFELHTIAVRVVT